MKRILFLLLIAFAFSPAVETSRSQSSTPTQDTRINLSGIWEDAGERVTITDSDGTVTARYSNQKQCRHEETVTPYTSGFIVSGRGSTLRGTGTICYYGPKKEPADPPATPDPSPRGVKQDSQVTITISADGKTLTGTQIGYHGPVNFTLTRKCDPDLSGADPPRGPFGPETPAEIAPSCESCPGGTWKLKLSSWTYHDTSRGDRPLTRQCVHEYDSIWLCPPTGDVVRRIKTKIIDGRCIPEG